MKIAIEARPIKWSYGTGIGNYTHSLIRKLSELDTLNEYTFLWPDTNPHPYIPFNRKYSFYSLPKEDDREDIEIPLWLNQEKADIFHLPQNGFRMPPKKAASKLIVTIHDLIPYFIPEMVRPSFLKRFTSEMPKIVEFSDHILTVSETSKNDIIKIFSIDPTKITVVPSAPNELFRQLPKEETKRVLRNRYHLKRPFILYVGGLNPRKNVCELIYAYSKIIRELAEGHQLVIPGLDSKNLISLKKMVDALNLQEDVFFPGFVPSEDLPLFYNGSDLFVYPSLYEGFGLPPIEAMACGVPVITSNVSSLPEVVGEAALKVNPYDTLELAEAIYRVLSDKKIAGSLIKAGLEHCQLYTWENNANRILEVYRLVSLS